MILLRSLLFIRHEILEIIMSAISHEPKPASIIGHFGFGQNMLNGQTIKTKIITEELQHQLGEDQVVCIDTHGGLKTLLRAPFQAISALKSSKNILIFPAQNGLRVYALCLLFSEPFSVGAACTMLSSAAGCRSFYQNANCLPAL